MNNAVLSILGKAQVGLFNKSDKYNEGKEHSFISENEGKEHIENINDLSDMQQKVRLV